MGYSYYRITAFIAPSSTVTFNQIADRIKDYIGTSNGVSVRIDENKLSVAYPNWSLRIYWEQEPHVLSESQEFAEHPKTPDAYRQFIASCDRRLTTAADDDPDMDYFNDFAIVINALESFEAFVLHDDNTGQFLGFPK